MPYATERVYNLVSTCQCSSGYEWDEQKLLCTQKLVSTGFIAGKRQIYLGISILAVFIVSGFVFLGYKLINILYRVQKCSSPEAKNNPVPETVTQSTLNDKI